MNPEQAQALRAPFPDAAIGKRPQGNVQLDFVGHAAVTDRLLRVDPEWTWGPLAYDEHGLPAFDRTQNGQPVGLWIRLTVCGVTRLGYGDAAGKTGGNAVKEIIGDALRNAGMRFGIALDLWSKEDLLDTSERAQETRTSAPASRRATPAALAPSPAAVTPTSLANQARSALWKYAQTVGFTKEKAQELADQFAAWSNGEVLSDADEQKVLGFLAELQRRNEPPAEKTAANGAVALP